MEFLTDEPQKASKERTVQRMEGSEAPGAGTCWSPSAHQTRGESAQKTAEAHEARQGRRGRGNMSIASAPSIGYGWNPFRIRLDSSKSEKLKDYESGQSSVCGI